MSRQIQLTQGKVALVDDADYETIARFKWFAHRCGRRRDLYYARRNTVSGGVRGVSLMHREVLGAAYGVLVDHRDHDGLNNRRDNLREATRTQNAQNSASRSSNTSGVQGVCFHIGHQRWRARITVHGERIHLGHFAAFEEAVRVRRAAELEYFGEFAPE